MSALPPGTRIGAFELLEAAPTASGFLYRARDVALGRLVGVEEYLPPAWAGRDDDGQVVALSPASTADLERGLRLFADEARVLARCDHPALLRVLHLERGRGSCYQVTPWYAARPLLDVPLQRGAPFSESELRVLLDDVLGALDAYHHAAGVHGGIGAHRVLWLDTSRALLLGPGAAARAAGAATAADTGFAAAEQAPDSAQNLGPWTDFYALAAVARYCITGLLPAPGGGAEPIAATLERMHGATAGVRYHPALLHALDAALSPNPRRRPQTAQQFRQMLVGAATPEPAAGAAARETAGVAAAREPAAAAVPAATAPADPEPDRVAPAPGHGPAQHAGRPGAAPAQGSVTTHPLPPPSAGTPVRGVAAPAAASRPPPLAPAQPAAAAPPPPAEHAAAPQGEEEVDAATLAAIRSVIDAIPDAPPRPAEPPAARPARIDWPQPATPAAQGDDDLALHALPADRPVHGPAPAAGRRGTARWAQGGALGLLTLAVAGYAAWRWLPDVAQPGAGPAPVAAAGPGAPGPAAVPASPAPALVPPPDAAGAARAAAAAADPAARGEPAAPSVPPSGHADPGPGGGADLLATTQPPAAASVPARRPRATGSRAASARTPDARPAARAPALCTQGAAAQQQRCLQRQCALARNKANPQCAAWRERRR